MPAAKVVVHRTLKFFKSMMSSFQRQ
jgi:hypothetical protein